MSRQIWLDLGKNLSPTTKTVASAMKKAGLSWKVVAKEVQVVGGEKIPDKLAIIREDTKDVLGVVNSTYKVIQNSQVFSFLDKFIEDGVATFYAAGYIGKGEKIWLILKLQDDINIKDDIIEKLILFTNAHDGRGALRAYFLPLRKKTKTLLNIYFGKRVEQGIHMRHVGKIEQRINDAKNIFKLADSFYTNFQEAIMKLYNAKLNSKKIEMFFEYCFEAYSISSTRTQNTFKKIKNLYAKELKSFPNSSNSAWAWFNAVVNFIDYDRLSKGKNTLHRTSNHLESLFWGSALLLKQRAWNSLSTFTKL